MNNKQKIFINYYSGACGHFFGLIIWMLLSEETPMLEKSHMAYKESSIMNRYHNLKSFWDYGNNQNKLQLIVDNFYELDVSIKRVQSIVKFYDTPYNFYIGYLHAKNAEPIMRAFDNSRLFNIVLQEGDLDQVAWNWLTKTGRYNNKALFINLNIVKRKYGKLLNVEHVDKNSSLELLFYIAKFSMKFGFKKFISHKDANWPSRFDISFRDIMNGEVKNKLTDITKFLGIDPNPDVIDHVNKMIDEYVASQTVPPEIDLDYFN